MSINKKIPNFNIKYSIHKRFNFLAELVRMVASGKTPSAIITGAGGLGKTYPVLQTLNELGLKDVSSYDEFEDDYELARPKKCFRFIKGYSTAKALYKTLYLNNGATIVFDDCDNILKDKIGINLLKSALDSYDTRILSWRNSLPRKNESLPSCFEFTGQIIFISNLSLETLPQPLRSRSLCVDVSMTQAQKFERMEHIIKQGDFMPEVTRMKKRQALAELVINKKDIKELSLRTLVSAVKIRHSTKQWKEIIYYSLVGQS